MQSVPAQDTFAYTVAGQPYMLLMEDGHVLILLQLQRQNFLKAEQTLVLSPTCQTMPVILAGQQYNVYG